MTNKIIRFTAAVYIIGMLTLITIGACAGTYKLFDMYNAAKTTEADYIFLTAYIICGLITICIAATAIFVATGIIAGLLDNLCERMDDKKRKISR